MTAATIVYVIIYLIVFGLIFWLLHWLIGYIGVPEPFNKGLKVVLAVGAVIVIILILLSLIGQGPGFIRLG